MNHRSVKNELILEDGRRIAYALTEGALPCVIFLGGFKSDMTGAKATALEAASQARGQRFVRFDYTGHGQSSGDFRDGTIGAWKGDALAVIDRLGGERVVLAGSSMGAWIALLCALERPQVMGLVGVASAPDFTEKLIWEKLDAVQQKQLLDEGVYYAPSCYGEDAYPITRGLIEEARGHVLLDRSIALSIPIRLIHGTQDEDVPWRMSVQLMERLASADVSLTLVKGGDHRMSGPEQLALLCETVKTLCQL